MFNRAIAPLVFALACCSGVVGAQSVGHQAIEAQRARLDSLLPELHAASQALHYGDSLRAEARRRRRIELDSAVIGPFIVITHDKEGREHFRNFSTAVNERAAILRGLQASPMELWVERDVPRGDGLHEHARLAKARHIRIFGSSPRLRLRFTRVAVDNAVFGYLPSNVQTWLNDSDLSKGRAHPLIYRELATSQSRLVQDCYRGVLAACTHALQFTNRERGSLSSLARASLLLHALEMGGAGSLARLRAAGDLQPADAIAAAARQPVNRVVQSWRNAITRGYVSHAGLPGAAAAAVFWGLIALMVSLRSTRRRAE